MKVSVPQRQLGNTGIAVSLLGLGLVKIGRNTGVKYPQHFELPSDQAVIDLLRAADTLGITLLDTAPAYGSSEARLGAALRDLPEYANRCLISTKVGETYSAAGSEFDFSRDAIVRSVERSLQRLGRDQLDIVLLHSSGADIDILTTHTPLATLQDLQRQGLIRACGFSGKTAAGGERALTLGAQVLMITLNTQERDQLPLLASAQQAGAGVFIKKPLASGHAAPGSLATLADHTAVSAIITGTLSPDHLSANAAAVSAGPTPPATAD